MKSEVEIALGEPIASEFSDYVRKIRASLIFVSVISISIVLGGLEIDSSSSILGLKFKNLNNTIIVYGLLSTNIYMLLHFLWCSFDAFQEWKLRVTGTRLVFITGGKYASVSGDYPDDARQSTLYHWWKEQAKNIGSLNEPIDNINNKLTIWEKEVKTALDAQQNPNVINACMSINQVAVDITQLKSSLETTLKVIESARIPESLKRFDDRFQLFLRSQNLRWLIIELTLPILIGCYSLVLLIEKLKQKVQEGLREPARFLQRTQKKRPFTTPLN